MMSCGCDSARALLQHTLVLMSCHYIRIDWLLLPLKKQ